MRYLVVIEETRTGYSAHSPDLQGCVATGRTRDEVETAMQGAVELHLEGMKAQGEDPPPPRTYSTYVDVR